jgi:hypothetical protein
MFQEQALRHARHTPAGASYDFSGRWRNQMGSTMELRLTGEALSGTYTSASSAAGASITGDLAGFRSGDQIAFAVKWQGADSLSTWVGQVVTEAGQDVIRTVWHVTMEVDDADEASGIWQSVLTGSDFFTRV